jgi:hypothetical protein
MRIQRQSTIAALVILAGVAASAQPLAAQRSAIPTPASVIGFEPGTDRRLPTWTQITDYFAALDRASPRVTVRTLGTTTLGRPFIAAFIGDSSTLANLRRYRDIQHKLADPRLRGAGERGRLVADGKVVVLITSSIHSTEVGGFMTPLVLAERLARAETAEARAILANTLVILVPSQNPDGVDIVGNWYRATLGTAAEGTSPPELYHKYTGHDNNRDWYMFTQFETQYTIDSLYTPWIPHIVNDVHQMGGGAARIFVPPYMDPVEPNIDPILTAGTNSLGTAMAWRLISDGKTGVTSNSVYDAWSPARQYSFFHRGVRILTETASARLASPTNVPFAQLGPGRGYDSRSSSWNFPSVWPGGTWTIGNIVDYQTSASWALLSVVANTRGQWVESYAAMGERALEARPPWAGEGWPTAFVIPKSQPEPQALQRLVHTMQRGGVEFRESTAPVTVDNETFPAGSYVVLTAQPFGGYAKALLERQRYPDLRLYPGGPPKPPYDVTAHTLPLLFGVRVAAVTSEPPRTGPLVPKVPEPVFTTPGLTDRASRRVAIYKSYNASMDEGWTRWIFESYRIPYTTVVDRDLRAGQLSSRFDVIILPDQSANALGRGLGTNYPDSLRGGIGDAGAAALKAFVEGGGTLIAFNSATEYASEILTLPVRNVLAGVNDAEFYAPGSILSADIRRDHSIGRGYVAPVQAIWFEDSPAFEITDPSRATAVVSYPAMGNPLLSGWLLGGDKLNGKAALVDVQVGRGNVVLFGFRPQYRAQTTATLPLLWGAILGRGAQ